MRFFAVFPLTAAQCWFGKQLVNTMLGKKEKTIRATGWRTLFDGSDLDKWSVGGDEVTLVGDALTIAKGEVRPRLAACHGTIMFYGQISWSLPKAEFQNTVFS